MSTKVDWALHARHVRGTLALMLSIYILPMIQAQAKAPLPVVQRGVQQPGRELDDLRQKILNLQQEIETLKTSLSFDEFLLKNKQDRSDSIILDLTQSAFQRLDTDTGFFLVSVEETAPYLNGYKIHMTIGNPSYATYANYKLKLRYNKSFNWGNYTQAAYDEWNKGMQEKEISYPDFLKPGTWNGVDVILAPATSDQLGYVTLSMSASTVSLHTQ